VRASERYPALNNAHLQATTPAKWPRLARAWDCFLGLLLVLWIVRIPLAMTLLGLGLLGLAPQLCSGAHASREYQFCIC
jgi:hypothetical protein